MKSPVMIKSNKYGILLLLDQDMDFAELLEQIAVKFKEAGNFFKNASMAVSFEGRALSDLEQQQIIDVIEANSQLKIICVVDEDKQREEAYKKSLEESLNAMSENEGGQFYRGTLRSGQVLEAESSIIILGDVNPGAKIVSSGNIIVLGTLKGSAYAGGNGATGAFVVALDMNPMQIRIGDVIARSSDKPKKRPKTPEPQIAFVEDGNIYIEKLTRDVINDIPFY